MLTLGIDWGEKRVGIAISDPLGMFAMPLCTLDVTSDKNAVRQVRELCEEKQAELIVVGLPVNMNGTQGPIHARATAFIERLERSVTIPVKGWDERMSSMAADRALDDAEVDNRKRKGLRDKIAAQVILQAYLDSVSDTF